MTQHKHPITPPPDKIHNWIQLVKIGCDIEQVLIGATQWGADQELEACCEALKAHGGQQLAEHFRVIRRPKPPSLKEQALEAMREMQIEPCIINGVDTNAAVRAKYKTIRRALEQLPDNEPSGISG